MRNEKSLEPGAASREDAVVASDEYSVVASDNLFHA